MKIGFVVNDVATEQPYYTTTRLAMTAGQLGHEVCLMGLGDFAYEPDGSLSALTRSASDKRYRSLERYLADVQKPEVARQLRINEFDVVMLRNDPAEDAGEKPWASTAAIAFGQLFAQAGVLVVNDPTSLANALSKAYFQHFPESVRPRTLISRDEGLLAGFIEELGGKAVLKPLQGSGGSGVFLVDRTESHNLNQIIEAIARDGYVVAQEYLPEAEQGDVRMFVMNGHPLRSGDTYAAFRRHNTGPDPRSNMKKGGKALPVDVTQGMLDLVDLIRPKLVTDGMFLVGLDIVGDKLMEVNVFTPGGLGSVQELYGVDFTPVIVAELERKRRIALHYGASLDNARLATL